MGDTVKFALLDLLRAQFYPEPATRNVTPIDAPFAFATDRGKKREENQDRVAVLDWVNRSGQRGLFAIVCDGMGGMEAGGLAAAETMSVLMYHAIEHYARANSHWLDNAAARANEEVYQRLRGKGGSVFVAALIADGLLTVVHAGDARAWYRSSTYGEKLLTRDHVLSGDGSLINFVGMSSDFQIERVELPCEGQLLLTTDGIHHPTGAIFYRLWENATHPIEAVTRFTDIAANMLEGTDNATIFGVNLDQLMKPDAHVREANPHVRLWTPALTPLCLPEWVRATTVEEARTTTTPSQSASKNAIKKIGLNTASQEHPSVSSHKNDKNAPESKHGQTGRIPSAKLPLQVSMNPAPLESSRSIDASTPNASGNGRVPVAAEDGAKSETVEQI